MMRTKKEIEKFSNNLKKLSDNIDNITNDVDEINNQFEGYNEQISGIKDNVKSLESELKEFMYEVKVTPLIEKAKKEIIKDKSELNRKYSKHFLIRERLLKIINNITNKDCLLKNEEIDNLKVADYYLYYILLGINDWISNKKTTNDRIKEALLLDKERTSLIMTLINIKLNKKDIALKWLDTYLDNINPIKTNDYLVKIIDCVKDNELLLNKIINKLNEWNNNFDNETLINIYDSIKNYIKIKEVKDDDYPYLCNYSEEYDNILDELYSSNIYSDFYNKLEDSLNMNSKDYIFLEDLINSEERYENELKTHILENEYIIKSNGKIKKFTKMENKDIISIFLTSLDSQIISKETKIILITYLKKYIQEYLKNFDMKEIDTINIKIGDWFSTTKNGDNENDLINNITEFVSKPFDENNKSLTIINFKTIYSGIFILIGFVVAFFNSVIGISMLVVGVLSLVYFIYSIDLQKKNNILLRDETISKYKEELYNLIAEIVDIKLEINNNLKNKDLLNELLDKIN